ncbi:SemiSWEET family sugar transporter [Tessaracoccus flavus]|uniref:Uncharacterized protein n=1 Tax=Tessaracoccus flavus TaxID=1610493 RepID=A0A1Q2CDL2_9ACTN|nr:PQ-loop domain-containing transporter [Tessaracoccus flavus]AQP44199.1 hypothetical protein RPIT_04685 [Tessaracoccus flavus]SDY37950.1 Uncharacterized conserved protein, contains PQ loop repeat [Tessaracoccus flavus]
MFIEVFGWVAAALGVSSNLPQLIRILRERTSAGVSVQLWQVTAASTAAWCVHGFLVSAPQMQWPNLLMAALSSLIVVMVLRDRGEPVLRQFLLPTAVAALLIGSNLWLGALVFGLLVAVPQLVGQFSQLRLMIGAPDLTGVSLGYLSVILLVQTMWFIFGLATVDWALIVCAGSMVVICSINLAVYLVRRAQHRVALAA